MLIIPCSLAKSVSVSTSKGTECSAVKSAVLSDAVASAYFCCGITEASSVLSWSNPSVVYPFCIAHKSHLISKYVVNFICIHIILSHLC